MLVSFPLMQAKEPDCWWSQRAANAANPANDSREQSTQSNDIGFNFEQPSDHVSHIYCVKTQMGSSWNAGERGGHFQSRVMRETHRRKQCKTASTRYSKGTSKGTRYKHLAPKDGSLTSNVSWVLESDVLTKEYVMGFFFLRAFFSHSNSCMYTIWNKG